jgi:hypothetical protein
MKSRKYYPQSKSFLLPIQSYFKINCPIFSSYPAYLQSYLTITFISLSQILSFFLPWVGGGRNPINISSQVQKSTNIPTVLPIMYFVCRVLREKEILTG